MTLGWSHLSSEPDGIFLLILAITVALLLAVTTTMLWFIVKFSRKNNPVPKDIEGNLLLEIVWTIIPTLLVLVIFYYGWKGFSQMRTVPEGAMTVRVTGQMWSWSFTYGNGQESDLLIVPVKQPVKLLITSRDVLHSLFIPAFRIKEDAVPGRETYLWFMPDELGAYDIFCTEYCGVGHSSMISKVKVLSREEFDTWYASAVKKTASKRERGAQLVKEKGCIGCHSFDGSPKIGPTLKGLMGRKVTVVTAGKEREIVVDEAYVRRSIDDPQADIVKGFPPIMPSQKGSLTEEEEDAIIEYLEELK